MVYGYVRVSTKEQNIDRQLEALKEYAKQQGLKYNTIFEDKATGKNFDRPQYQAMKVILKAGDVLVIKELDRLGRNYEEIKKELAELQLKGVKVRILDLPMFNTDDETLSSLLNNLVVELLSYIAQKEREKIQARVKEGLQQAKIKGIKLGRPERKLPKDFEKYYKKWNNKEITAVEFAKLLGISRATLYRYIQFYEKRGLKVNELIQK